MAINPFKSNRIKTCPNCDSQLIKSIAGVWTCPKNGQIGSKHRYEQTTYAVLRIWDNKDYEIAITIYATAFYVLKGSGFIAKSFSFTGNHWFPGTLEEVQNFLMMQ